MCCDGKTPAPQGMGAGSCPVALAPMDVDGPISSTGAVTPAGIKDPWSSNLEAMGPEPKEEYPAHASALRILLGHSLIGA